MPVIAIASAELTAEIDPHGAQLHALRDGAGRDLLWGGDARYWTGRAPILFPIVGMLNGGEYRLDGRAWRMAKHGFARHKTFAVAEARPGRAVFRLREDPETLAQYPFPFELELAFALAGPTLAMTATVRNPGPAPLPASFGFHPALRWPLPDGRARSAQDAGEEARRAAHRLTFAQDEPAPIRRIDSRGLLTEARLPTPVRGRDLALTDGLFEADALIFDRLASRRLRYGAGPDAPALEITFPDTPLLGVWTKPGAGFLCIEPWHGIADPVGYAGDFRDKPDVFVVPPGGEKAMRMGITLAA